MDGVSFVVPVHNGATCVRGALESILAQADGRPMEVIVVDDASQDDSSAVLQRLAETWPLRIVAGEGRGAAAASNTGVRAARFPIICQVDQDVVLKPGWMRLLTAQLDDPTVGAAQGYYVSEPGVTLCARAMGLDLEQRYQAIDGPGTGHVCTGNSAYRADALRRVGYFDETLGYGYDNDLSYRLRAAGYRLIFCRDARSVHLWREGIGGYLVQQYGFGYGRIDLVAKHPRRIAGDSVSPAGVMAHPVLMAIAILNLLIALFARVAPMAGLRWRPFVLVALTLIVGLALERLAAGIGAACRFRTATPLVFPLLHLCRDVVWVAAIAVWLARRICGRQSRPAHSMRPRTHTILGRERRAALQTAAQSARPVVGPSE
jgi:cellulose synthase/poly-beta-1,6-N-acetylglucosamine synthase-like glycosyltransferase